MSEVTYHPEVRCEVQEIVPPVDHVAQVRDIDGRLHQIPVPRSMTRRQGTSDYLSIGIVRMDQTQRRALIEFPAASGQGTNRAWVGFEELWQDADDLDAYSEAERIGPSAETLMELTKRFPPPQEWWNEDFEGL